MKIQAEVKKVSGRKCLNVLIDSPHIKVGDLIEIELPDPPLVKTAGERLYEIYRTSQSSTIRSCWAWSALGELTHQAWEDTAKAIGFE